MECLRPATVSVRISGSPTCFSFASTGLRMGDPLSHFLFVIIGEALSHMFACGS